jgi:hypothetical protein
MIEVFAANLPVVLLVLVRLIGPGGMLDTRVYVPRWTTARRVRIPGGQSHAPGSGSGSAT